ncbi:MAG TPA: hypothetical protein VGD50_04410 [Candidatus Baltobacteraceae bacterium]
MLTILAIALGLGFVSGLRTFVAPAAVLLARGGIGGYAVSVLALGELIGDMLPSIPSRTSPPALAARALSGAFVGWTISSMHGGPIIAGGIAGLIGALAGAYGGKAARIAAIERIGPIPAALTEDVIAIALAAFLVTR